MARPLPLVARLVYRGPPIAVRSLRISNPQARDHELPLRRDVAAGVALGALPGSTAGALGTVMGGLLLSGPDCGPGGFGGPAVGANDAVAFSQRRIDWSGKRDRH